MEAGAETDTKGKVNVRVEDLDLDTYGLSLDAGIKLTDLIGDDPLVEVDGRMRASADSLVSFLPEDYAIHPDSQARNPGSFHPSFLTVTLPAN